jgi:calcineurin-like phosphoesterase
MNKAWLEYACFYIGERNMRDMEENETQLAYQLEDRIIRIQECDGGYDYSIMDIHAETTSEKIALATYFDGKIDMMFGTHTHVMTADEKILPKGSGYITDIGMCGPVNSALGVKTEIIIEKLKTSMPSRFELSDNPVVLQGVVFTLEKGKVCGVERIEIK